MSPRSERKRDTETLLQEALATAEHSQTKYHIREALQLTDLDQ